MASFAYTLTSGGLTLANQAVTLGWLNPAAAPQADIFPLRFWCGQSQDNTSKMQRVQLNTQVTAFPTLVSATPTKLWGTGPASMLTGATNGAAGTSGINASAEGAGPKTIIWSDVFNNVNGHLLILTPDEELQLSAGSASGIGYHFPVAALPLTNWTFGIAWKEK